MSPLPLSREKAGRMLRRFKTLWVSLHSLRHQSKASEAFGIQKQCFTLFENATFQRPVVWCWSGERDIHFILQNTVFWCGDRRECFARALIALTSAARPPQWKHRVGSNAHEFVHWIVSCSGNLIQTENQVEAATVIRNSGFVAVPRLCLSQILC